MAHYTAEVVWHRADQDFLDNRYSRKHWIRFDGGVEIPGSSSPHVVPLPMSDTAAVDPEEAFVAALSSCHMLWFLSISAAHGFRIDTYMDAALGKMGKNSDEKVAMTHVMLKPAIRFSGDRIPTPEQIQQMHHEAHEACYLANSVKTVVSCEPVFLTAETD
jgi:organic hydroperoxide reductase OsmC/OhrA